MSSHVKHEHDLFIKRVSCVNPNITRIRLASTHNLFINELVVSGSWVVLDFGTPTYDNVKRKDLYGKFLLNEIPNIIHN